MNMQEVRFNGSRKDKAAKLVCMGSTIGVQVWSLDQYNHYDFDFKMDSMVVSHDNEEEMKEAAQMLLDELNYQDDMTEDEKQKYLEMIKWLAERQDHMPM